MSRFYQHMLTGKQVEVKTLDEDDFYVENSSTWARIAALSKAKKPATQPATKPPAVKKKG